MGSNPQWQTTETNKRNRLFFFSFLFFFWFLKPAKVICFGTLGQQTVDGSEKKNHKFSPEHEFLAKKKKKIRFSCVYVDVRPKNKN